MKKRFSDIQVGDIVYYVHPRHDYFEICDLEFVEKKEANIRKNKADSVGFIL